MFATVSLNIFAIARIHVSQEQLSSTPALKDLAVQHSSWKETLKIGEMRYEHGFI